MDRHSQTTLVEQQFGARAQAYVGSAVHANGPDLQHLAQRVSERQDPRVLDLGCGGGHASFAAAAHARRVTALDLSTEMLEAVAAEAARRGITNIDTRAASVDRLPFPERSYDIVCSRFSAHHWPSLEAGLAEARRVLKADGLAIFMDIASPGPALLDTHLQSLELLRDPSHVRDYSLAEWMQALTSSGFSVTGSSRRRLRIDFAEWIARMRTPDTHVGAIRALQQQAPTDVASHFDLETDGSFHLDAITIDAIPLR